MILACYFAVTSYYMKAKKCSKCHTTFSCGSPEPGCWCETIHLSNDTLKLLKEQYDNCLCPVCLKGFEQAQPVSSTTHLPG